MDILIWLAIGVAAGGVASFVTGAIGFGRAGDATVGFLGALVGGWVFAQLQWVMPFPGLAGAGVVALVGAIATLMFVGALHSPRGRRR
jgi:uncharacterized membrane protein YeaQ/YmgE (transglycosylase-associated protein family)